MFILITILYKRDKISLIYHIKILIETFAYFHIFSQIPVNKNSHIILSECCFKCKTSILDKLLLLFIKNRLSTATLDSWLKYVNVILVRLVSNFRKKDNNHLLIIKIHNYIQLKFV